jgi:threonine/homoserine/homoserine lactone efflux protein
LIESLEKEQQDIRSALADSSLFAKDPAKAAALFARVAQIDEALLAALERWEALSAARRCSVRACSAFNPEELTALLVLSTAASFTPGPNTALSTAIAANQGLRAALKFIVSVPIGWGLLLSLCMVGMGQLVLAAPALRWLIMLGGTLDLFVDGLQFVGHAAIRAQADSKAFEHHIFARCGGSVFLNIKAWMFALSVVAGWVLGKDNALERCLVLLPLMMGYGLCSSLTYALMGSLLRDRLSHGDRLLVFNRSMAVALVLTAVWMFQTGL